MLKEEIDRYRALAASVLWTAIDDHQREVKGAGSIQRGMQAEPALWIFDDDPRPFGYVWCCGVLDIPVYRIRMLLNVPVAIGAVFSGLRTNAEER